jgi:hypothetical protein
MTGEARERSFDELARGLASGSISRGKALRLMGAALVGGALASVGMREAAADPIGCKRNGKACKKDTQCCSGNCEGGICAAAAPPTCPPGTVLLSNGTCAKSCTTAPECPGCTCYGNVENTFEGYCGIDSLSLPPSSSCTTHADCPTGQFCGAFGENVCIPTC